MKRATIIRTLWHWHRRLGLVACILLLILAVTGILLNHSAQWGWDRSPISSQWILQSYGFEPPEDFKGLKLNDQYWIKSGDQIFYNDQSVALCNKPWHSLLELDGMVVAACPDQIALFADDGSLLESINTLPQPNLQNAARVEGERRLLLVYLLDQQYLWDPDSLEVETTTGLKPLPAEFVAVPEDLAESLADAFRVKDLTWERFVLDLHAGRWFGGWGWVLMDLGALFMLALSISGVAMYTLRRTR